MQESPSLETGSRGPRTTTLIVASSIGTYLLILTGVSNALSQATTACSTWPLCSGPWLESSAKAVVIGHRLTALLVGLILLATIVRVIKTPTSRKVRAAVILGSLLYPFQVVLGAKAAVSGISTAIGTLHLVTAMSIFTALLAALIWQLDDHIAASPESKTVADPPSTETPPARPEPNERFVQDHGLVTIARAYLRLTKPYLWWLLSLVALASMGLAAGGIPPLNTTLATISGGVFAIGASATFNNVLEREQDELMHRTSDRPIVTDIVPPRRAIAFGFILLLASMTVFVSFVNVLAAGLALLAVLFYSVVYTMLLKPRTDQNTVIGGAVGALPALIGWAAITDTIGVPAIVLGVVVFLWTPAHFYNLALIYKDDYARAGFPMLPVVRGERTTRLHIAAFLGATMLAAVLLGTATALGPLYAGVAVVFGALFLIVAVHLNRVQTDRAAKRTFVVANVYLGALLFAIVLDTMAI